MRKVCAIKRPVDVSTSTSRLKWNTPELHTALSQILPRLLHKHLRPGLPRFPIRSHTATSSYPHHDLIGLFFLNYIEAEVQQMTALLEHTKEKQQSGEHQRSTLTALRTWFGCLGMGIILDFRARAPWYWSDWVDSWNYRIIPATALIFFAK